MASNVGNGRNKGQRRQAKRCVSTTLSLVISLALVVWVIAIPEPSVAQTLIRIDPAQNPNGVVQCSLTISDSESGSISFLDCFDGMVSAKLRTEGGYELKIKLIRDGKPRDFLVHPSSSLKPDSRIRQKLSEVHQLCAREGCEGMPSAYLSAIQDALLMESVLWIGGIYDFGGLSGEKYDGKQMLLLKSDLGSTGIIVADSRETSLTGEAIETFFFPVDWN